MVLFLLKIHPSPGSRRELLEILHSLRGPISISNGFISSGVFEGSRDDETVLYMEQWDTLSNLHRHIQSPFYSRILAAVEFSTIPPELKFYEMSQSWGLELIESLRTPKPS